MIRVITVEREFGSGGDVIAAEVAKRLGWTLWDEALTDTIAERLECDRGTVAGLEEHPVPAYQSLSAALLRGVFDVPRLKIVDADRVWAELRTVARDLAAVGRSVIVGRGSAYHLGARNDAFHVFVYAPFDHRKRRLTTPGRSEQEATELVKRMDRCRAAFVKERFKLEWPAIHRFHLMVNASRGDDVAVDTILTAVARGTEAMR